MAETSRSLSMGEALDLGTEYAMAGNHKSAMMLFRGVLIHDPLNFEAIERLGSSLFEDRQIHEALYWFWRGIKINRRNPLSLTNYGLTISQLGHYEEGLEFLRLAVFQVEKTEGVSPAVKALVYTNMGNTLERLLRHEEALEALDKAVAYNAEDPFPHYNRGIALLRLNRHREAIDAIERSLILRPPATDSTSRLNEADALYNRGTGRLILGDLKRGLPDYDARHTTSDNKTPNLNLPPEKQWKGEPLEGKKLLVHAEQGLGDTIQFLRFLPPLMERCSDVHLVVQTALRPFANAIPGLKVSGGGEELPEYDYWIAIMSLAHRLGVEREQDIPKPWLPDAVGDGRRILAGAELPQGFCVAVCWAGNWQHKNNAHRSIPLETFAELFDAPCQFISVQQMQQADTHAFAKIKDTGKYPNVTALWLNDFRDTAAVLLNCDLVISVDTATAHLAGSLGVPTWVLIAKYGTDWRWQLEREDSPWYPSVRLFRQAKIGDWESVITRMRKKLSNGQKAIDPAGVGQTKAATNGSAIAATAAEASANLDLRAETSAGTA
jgi:tetratricopeptide (TPR) repeat protein